MPSASGTTSEQRPRVRVRRLGQHLLRRPDLDDAAQVHHRDPVGDRPRQAQVVRDDQDADPSTRPAASAAAGGSRRAPTRPGSTPVRRPRSRAAPARAPRRSRRAGADRPTARAGTAGRTVPAGAGPRATARGTRAPPRRPAPCGCAGPRPPSRRSSVAGSARRSGPDRPSAPCAGTRGDACRAARPRTGSRPSSGWTNPMIERASVVLPHPDSPASARISPSSSVRFTPSTARAMRCAFVRRSARPRPRTDVQVTRLQKRDVRGPSDLERGSRRRLRGSAVGVPAPAAGTPRARPSPAGNERWVDRSNSGRTPPRNAGGSCSRSARRAGPADRRPARSAPGCSDSSPMRGERTGERLSCTGASGRRRPRAAGPSSTIRPAYMTASRSLTSRQHREVVRDEQHREPQVALEVASAAAAPAPAP